MFRKLNLPERFAVLGALLFLLAGSMFTYVDYRLAIERMEEVRHSANKVVIRTLWSHLQNHALPLFGITTRGPAVRGMTSLIMDEVEQQAAGTLFNTDIDKIKIYDAQGRVLYSTDRSQINTIEANNSRFQLAITGEEVSIREKFSSITTIHGAQRDIVMQATYIPIYNPAAPDEPIGVFEIYTDFTGTEKVAQVRAWIRVGVLVLGLLILYALLVLIVTHSDRALRKAEEDRGQALAEVTKVRAEDASKSAFLAHMSHELRTPLNAIIGFSEFIEKSGNLKISREKIMEYAADIRMSAVHLLRIINDLLDLTRLDLGRIRPEIGPVKLVNVFNEAISMVRTQAGNGNVALETQFTSKDIVVQSDRQRVKQILVNLLSNAVKFTPDQGTVTCILSAHPEDNLVLLKVCDTGIGMSGDETSDRLNVLKYGDAMIARKLAGVGLGLPLCHRYANLLGGDIRIDSQLGRGTNVALELPILYAGAKSAPEADSRAVA